MAPQQCSPLSLLTIETCPLASLKPNGRSTRVHSKRQIKQIAASIREFGFNCPVLVDFFDEVIAGDGRVEAARQLGLETIPIIRIEHLSGAQIRAFMIAENRITENAGWDSDKLGAELESLLSMEVDVEATGFEMGEIDLLIGGQERATGKKADKLPLFAPELRVSRHGDLWKLGKHKVLCAEATNLASFAKLMGSEKATLVFTAPPYNIDLGRYFAGSTGTRNEVSEPASGKMSEGEYRGFLKGLFQNLVAHSVDGSIHYISTDWRHMSEVLAAGRDAYSFLKDLCVWNKTKGEEGPLYDAHHELVFVFKNGRSSVANGYAGARHRSNVWTYKSNAAFATRLERATHPAHKPGKLVADAILDYSQPWHIVLDCFGGIGTTLIAAHATKRRAYLIEHDPDYVDITLERYRLLTGETAVHGETGLDVSQIREKRASKNPEVAQ